MAIQMTNPFSASFIHLSSNSGTHQASNKANTVSLNNSSISHSDDFKHYYIKNETNQILGVIIGNPVRNDTFLHTDIITDTQNWEEFENLIYSLTGRYVVIGNFNNKTRLYLDASGSLPIIYDSNKKIASSSSMLILGDDYDTKLDTHLLQQLGIPKSGLWIPSGLTAHKSVYRVIPNHYLDLDNWIINRHWPTREMNDTADTDELIHRITSDVKNTCTAIASSHTPVFSITAGRDSRMLLACVKHLVQQSEFFTFSTFPGSVDTNTANKISREYNLNHTFLKIEKPPDKHREHWLRWNGHCISGAIWSVQHSLAYFKENYAILPAMAGEVGRSFYWKENDRDTLTLTASEMLIRLDLPQTNKLLEASERYVDSLPNLDFFSLLDLVYIEQRLGCWGNLSTYTGNFYAPHYLPLSSRKIFTSMMSLPREYKFKQQLCNDLIRTEWPELLQYPFNEYQGVFKLKKLLDNAFLAPSYLYKKFKTGL